MDSGSGDSVVLALIADDGNVSEDRSEDSGSSGNGDGGNNNSNINSTAEAAIRTTTTAAGVTAMVAGTNNNT